MRFIRLTLFALFWVAIGLGMGLVPINGTTVWQKLFQTATTNAQKVIPIENYAASERANINQLIQTLAN